MVWMLWSQHNWDGQTTKTQRWRLLSADTFSLHYVYVVVCIGSPQPQHYLWALYQIDARQNCVEEKLHPVCLVSHQSEGESTVEMRRTGANHRAFSSAPLMCYDSKISSVVFCSAVSFSDVWLFALCFFTGTKINYTWQFTKRAKPLYIHYPLYCSSCFYLYFFHFHKMTNYDCQRIQRGIFRFRF